MIFKIAYKKYVVTYAKSQSGHFEEFFRRFEANTVKKI
jgi:hypothetical protein